MKNVFDDFTDDAYFAAHPDRADEQATIRKMQNPLSRFVRETLPLLIARLCSLFCGKA